MEDIDRSAQRNAQLKKSHMPQHSVFFEKVVPILLAGMGVLTVVLILFAAGILLGIIKF